MTPEIVYTERVLQYILWNTQNKTTFIIYEITESLLLDTKANEHKRKCKFVSLNSHCAFSVDGGDEEKKGKKMRRKLLYLQICETFYRQRITSSVFFFTSHLFLPIVRSQNMKRNKHDDGVSICTLDAERREKTWFSNDWPDSIWNWVTWPNWTFVRKWFPWFVTVYSLFI